jgi:hypothetical protein
LINAEIDIKAIVLEVKINAKTGDIIRDTMIAAVRGGFPRVVGLVVKLLLISRAVTIHLSLISLRRGEASSRESLEGLIGGIVRKRGYYTSSMW